jgi:hypothetical protein
MRAMKRVGRALGLTLSLMISATGARAQSISATHSASPVQGISISQFNQLVQSGQLTRVNPTVQNQDVVKTFIQQHPNLPGFSQLVDGIPTDRPERHPHGMVLAISCSSYKEGQMALVFRG